MDLGLQGKTAIVTGGATGIGAAISRSFAAEGANVCIVGLPDEHGPRLADELANAVFAPTDLRDPEACTQAVHAATGTFGAIDILVNNAGVNDVAGLDAGPEAFAASLQTNLVHYYTMAHLCLPQLRSTRGTIINVGSKVAETGQGGTSGYAAAKGGANALTREWALDLAKDGIRVNAVIPAEVYTQMYADWLATQPDPQAAKEAIVSRIPFERRMTKPQEIADAVVFLASTRSTHTTGQIFHVDGGYVHFDRRYS